MLFKQVHLEGIRSGKILLAFRKWRKPAVRTGSLIKTSVGQIEVVDMVKVDRQAITNQQAQEAGFVSLEDLLRLLDKVKEGNIHKVTVRYHSMDPRIALREQNTLSDKEIDVILNRLQRMDRYGKQGAWTTDILKTIQQNPRLSAADLALKLGKEKDWLKLNIRKLKNLGLTISHDQGYEISPMGNVVLGRLDDIE